jgi:GT2 family glycosyltransferase
MTPARRAEGTRGDAVATGAPPARVLPDRVLPEHARAVRSASGRLLVPGNRWDLAPAAAPGRTSVVVPYFEDPAGLRRLVASLDAQTHPAAEVVVVDDGSRRHPARTVLADRPDVTVLWQPDHGNRTAAARNRGAAAATGDVLVFLDGDVVAHPRCLEVLAALPTALPDALVVGRRVHADLTGLDATAALRAGLDARSPRRLPDPVWLAEGYRATRDLRDLDARSWRYIISAALAVDRRTFHAIGGFDAAPHGYGGEDWALAHRALHAGAVLAHRPEAVVVHDGADLAGRGWDPSVKAAETAWLLERITDRTFRPPGPCWPTRRISAVLHDRGWSEAHVLACVQSLLAGLVDVDVHLTGRGIPPLALAADPRVHAGGPPDRSDHVEIRLDVHHPVDADADLVAGLAVVDPGRADRLVVQVGGRPVVVATAVRTTRRLARATCDAAESTRLWTALATEVTVDGTAAGVRPVPDDLDLEAWFDRPLRSPAAVR